MKYSFYTLLDNLELLEVKFHDIKNQNEIGIKKQNRKKHTRIYT